MPPGFSKFFDKCYDLKKLESNGFEKSGKEVN